MKRNYNYVLLAAIFGLIAISLTVSTVVAVSEPSLSSSVVTVQLQPTGSPTPEGISQQQLLSTYSEVLQNSQTAIETIRMTADQTLETSQSATESVRSTTELVLTIVGIAFAALVLEGFGSLWLIASSQRKIEVANKEVKKFESNLEKVAQKMADVQTELQNGVKALSDLQKQELVLQKEAFEVSERIRDIQADIEWFEELMLFVQIRQNSLRLYADDLSEQHDAANTLREMLEHKEPLARFEVVHEFYEWARDASDKNLGLTSRIVETLDSLIENEQEKRIILVARSALETLNRGIDSPSEQASS